MLGIRISKTYGGCGLTWVDNAITAEWYGEASCSLACLLGAADMTKDAVRPAINIATLYTARRKAFGQPIMIFQALGFMIIDTITALDADRSMVYSLCLAAHSNKVDDGRKGRMV